MTQSLRPWGINLRRWVPARLFADHPPAKDRPMMGSHWIHGDQTAGLPIDYPALGQLDSFRGLWGVVFRINDSAELKIPAFHRRGYLDPRYHSAYIVPANRNMPTCCGQQSGTTRMLPLFAQPAIWRRASIKHICTSGLWKCRVAVLMAQAARKNAQAGSKRQLEALVHDGAHGQYDRQVSSPSFVTAAASTIRRAWYT